MRRILFLAAHPAFPAITGADLRNWQNASAAAKLGPVRFVSVLAAPEGSASPAGIEVRHLGGAAASLYRPVAGLSSIDLHIEPPMLSAFAAMLTDFRPDTVVVEHLGLHPFLRLAGESGARLVLDLHNVESHLAAQIPLRRDWFGTKRRRDSRAIAEIEAAAIARVDQVWCCSADDAGRLAARGLGEAIVVPNGLPRPETAPVALGAVPPPPGPELLFIGHLGYKPNIAACGRLARRILPRLRRRLPEARLTLAGRHPARRVRRLAAAGVRIVADPDELAPLLASAHIAVVPLTSGGGTRFKIVEAMAWGLPVVATRLAAEGLGLADGEDLLLAESDRVFADTIESLWRDEGRRAALRSRAHAAAWQRFGPEPIERAVLGALRALAAPGAVPNP
ncbi:glycosyltransferase family 4 protein [Kaistia sp. MMO-174]|uniref:glycosyltransferase family 4 protein n=1 Tax=Kaistia sp. MMO-174 TaxID=3081256 RepID=UPI001ACCF646|nr:glycosyltransferase family 4 protein [Hyphomicrobiales bacterium]